MKKLIIASIILATCHFTFGQKAMETTDKQIRISKIFNQSLDTLWHSWTTHEGLKTFFGKDNKIELVPDGAFEIYFLLDKPIGLQGSEGCKVLSYLPKKNISFSWNAPPQFVEERKSGYKTWVVVEFNFITNDQTELILTHLGWPKDENWNVVYDYFDVAWKIVLDRLSKRDIPIAQTSVNTKKVTGIGGIFFKCKDPDKMKEWYKIHLGLATDKYGTNFEWRQASDPNMKGFTQWSPFAETTKYFEPSTKDFMLNYRVENLVDLVEQLKKEGVVISDTIESFSYGKFVHILDIEGNKIELWEPNDSEYDKFEGGRTK
jgi:uncharacterized protein YndB with AHSA1/START domain/predicted enzyme related to lactoylglutathione lyase